MSLPLCPPCFHLVVVQLSHSNPSQRLCYWSTELLLCWEGGEARVALGELLAVNHLEKEAALVGMNLRLRQSIYSISGRE